MDILKRLDIHAFPHSGSSTGSTWLKANNTNVISSYSPIDEAKIGEVSVSSIADCDSVVRQAQSAFVVWRNKPAPYRGEVVRQIGDELRHKKDDLAQLVSYEMGKSYAEALGEVQEMIDICDFAVGLSRQLYGLTIHSERPAHRMYEQWHPLGIVGIISAFNFPVAVWSWNAMIALVCGDTCIWKPSEKTPFCAIACQKIVAKVLANHQLPEGILCLINGDATLGRYLSENENIALVSATGSTRMGKDVAATVARRLGRSLLELGGNNAIILSEHADIALSIPGIVFGAVGTAGQRCTTTRRLIVHSSIFDKVIAQLQQAYKQLKIGNPLNTEHHVGPLIDELAVQQYEKAIAACKEQGGRFIVEGGRMAGKGHYVLPCIAVVDDAHIPVVQQETFAPILYVMKYETLEEAIAIQNQVPQGLSSAIMTLNMREAETFLSAAGSDCGIANVNIGTSGAEIGGAFGGEKETGGGRESGSDSWKAYMRRQTVTINYSTKLPLAQGIKFDLGT